MQLEVLRQKNLFSPEVARDLELKWSLNFGMNGGAENRLIRVSRFAS